MHLHHPLSGVRRIPPDGWVIRTSLPFRVGVSLVAAGIAVIGTWIGCDDSIVGAAATSLLFTALSVVGAWRYAFAPRIVVKGPHVRVVNPYSTRDLPLAGIRSATPGYYGIDIEYRAPGGTSEVVTAWVATKGNGADWLRIKVRADRIAAMVMRAAEQARVRAGAG